MELALLTKKSDETLYISCLQVRIRTRDLRESIAASMVQRYYFPVSMLLAAEYKFFFSVHIKYINIV
jgi:hypothetical protein